METPTTKNATYIRPKIVSYSNADIVKKLGPAYTVVACSSPEAM